MNQRRGIVILAMALGLLMGSLDNTIVSASINNVIKDLGGFDLVSWVFTAYVLASTSTMLIFGKMSDLFGRKLLYLLGLGFFILGSALCGTAGSMEQLIVYRTIQGIGAGSLFPISFTIIYSLFPKREDAAKLTGIFAGIFGLSSVAGPQIGTWLSAINWRLCFYVNIPFGLLSFLLILFFLKETRSDRKPAIDYLGTVLLVITTISLMLGLEWAGKKYDWTSWQILGLFATALVFGTLFILVERKAAEPVLPLPMFKNRLVSMISLVSLCQGAIMFSVITYLPIFAVGVLGFKNSNTILTPMMFSVMIGASSSGFLQRFVPVRAFMIFTSIFAILASYLLSTVPFDASTWYMIGLMVMMGAGALGPMFSVAQNAVAQNVEPKYLGIVSSVIGFWRNIGGILGTAITATIVNNQLKETIQNAIANQQLPPQGVKFANPELLMRAGKQIPEPIFHFLRDALGTAIHYGFYMAIGFGVISLLASLIANERKPETSDQGESNQPAPSTNA